MSPVREEAVAAADDRAVRGHLACPACHAPLHVPVDAASCSCDACLLRFERRGGVWDFVPPSLRVGKLWDAWDQLQANGVASYEADPMRNLSVGHREDCARFSAFCAYAGLVLDVGCGPQAWPAYLDRARDATYVGVDPLAGEGTTEFVKVRALAEHLPFRDGVFDQAVFATTLDHFVDPAAAIREASRVCKPGGVITIWFGEKRADAPRPATSPEWYRGLVKPELADDFFHVKRLSAAEFDAMLERTPLRVIERQTIPVDAWRTNHFIKLRNGGPWTS
jgi:SAM-dependent methyltransferase